MEDNIVAPLSAQVKQNPKGGFTVPGNVPLGKEETADLLARMQEMVDQRQSPLNLLLSGLKDASAAGSGGLRGPTEAINLRDRQKAAEAQELFRMRSDMAALRSAQAMAEKQDVGLDQLMGVAKPVTGGNEQPQGGQVIGPSGQPVPDLILKQMAQKRRIGDRAGAQAIYDDWAKTQVHKDIETAGRAESYSQEVKLYDRQNNGQLTTVPAIEAMRNPSRYSYVPITGTTPTDTGTKVTGTPTGGQPKYLNTSAAQTANKLGNTVGEFTDDELNRLASTESGKDPFALNKETKAMGRYQFMPETVQSLHQRGVAFNPFDEKQSREVARSELNRLSKELGSKELALAAYGGFREKDPTKYIGGILTTTPAQTVATTTTTATSAPPASTGNRAQDLQNLKNWEKSQEKELEIASKGPEKASTAAGERRAKMFELAGATDDTVKAADMAIAASTNVPEATGIGKGKTGANFLVTTAGAIIPKMDKAKAEDIYGSFQDERAIKAREAIVGSSKQLGIDFAANVFKGARMGIGLENMAANAKNVSEYNTAETNIFNAKLIKEAALFNKARADLYNQWAPKNGGAMANFEKFETSDEYKALAKATQEKIASELPQYLKLGKDGLEEVNPSKKSNSQNDARAELERRKKAKGNQ
jgi:hypothetical protein